LRWRVKAEVRNGKGFDSCGNKHCPCYYYQDNDDSDNINHGIVNGNMNGKKKITKKRNKNIDDVIRWKKNVQNRQILDNYKRELLASSHDLKLIRGLGRKQEQQDQQQQLILQKKEQERLQKVPYGLGLYDYSIHFKYREHDQVKEELVQLKLCLRCAPKLFHVREEQKQISDDNNKRSDSLDDKIDNDDHIGADGGSLMRALHSRLENGSNEFGTRSSDDDDDESCNCAKKEIVNRDDHKSSNKERKRHKRKKRRHKKSKHSKKKSTKRRKYSYSYSSDDDDDADADVGTDMVGFDNDESDYEEGKDAEKLLVEDIRNSLNSTIYQRK